MLDFIISTDTLVIIKSILLIISGMLIIIASLGILKLDKNMPNVVYARIHILGVIDIAGVIAFLGLGQPLFAIIYFILAPFLAHAMSNAYFHVEDNYNNSFITKIVNSNHDNDNFTIGEYKEFNKEDSEDKYSVSTLKINEDE